MLSQNGFAALADIHDAAVNLGRWRRALDAVSKAADAKAIALLIRQPGEGVRDLQMLNSTYLNFVRSPWGLYYGLRYSHLQEPDWDFLSRQPVQVPTLDTEIGPSTAALDRRADYAFLRKKLGVGRRFGVRLNSDRVWFDAMSVAFDTERQTVPQSSLAEITSLLPHLTKAVEIGRTFSQLKQRYAAVLSALDHVKIGLAIALPTGEIVVQNAEADRILEPKDGLTKDSDGRLRCADPNNTEALTSAIKSASLTAQGEANAAECPMTLPRRSSGGPLLLDVAPLHDSQSDLSGRLEGALITLIDPDRLPDFEIDRFSALYNLTPAEADVCGFVLRGENTKGIAERRNTSPVTVKNQIATVLEKTDTHSRAELIRLVLRVLPPVR